MNKNKIYDVCWRAAMIVLIFGAAGAARAQIEIDAANFSVEKLKFKREFSPVVETDDEKIFKRDFAARTKTDAPDAVTSDAPSNAPNAAPRRQTYVRPSKEARFKRYASDAFGVPALIGATFGATFSQIGNDPPEWERTAGGFARRYASAYATNAIRNSISYGVSEAFRLDNRFEKRGNGSFGKRLKHVFLGSYTTRTRTGKRIPDFPHFVGTYSAAVIANETWFPKRFGYQDGLRDGTVSLGIRFGVNLLREFIFPD